MGPDGLDMDGAATLISDLAGRDLDGSTAWRQLVAWCASNRPHADWERFRTLDFDAELQRLRGWLGRVLHSAPPDPSVTGLYFGLFNPVYDDGEPVADVYVAGGIYGSGDWLSSVSEHWFPEGRYAHSELLAQVYRTAYASEGSLGNDAEYPLVLGFGVLAAKHLCQDLGQQLLARGRTELWIAAGFDSGDVLTLGRLTPSGLAISPAW
ncbi:hypothetical protein [Anaeromyxobacter oryzae]|uniref:Uncharacterized protein n=1 Tax=Anaeromyxobacter oryzae TaxID=2918170 RepID=A0ABM7WZ15_9BACT|nr:hypothetical protein [Anaeromyxobacter oryzae]BDG04795.1 hypothetical protein AMOR_37910 [Anaeromyxobacter oryzae]